MSDIDDIIGGGILDYVRSLKESGVVRHLGFSSHTPAVANKLIDMGCFDMMMFSITPAYDFEFGGELGIGSVGERAELFRRCFPSFPRPVRKTTTRSSAALPLSRQSETAYTATTVSPALPGLTSAS